MKSQSSLKVIRSGAKHVEILQTPEKKKQNWKHFVSITKTECSIANRNCN